MDNLPTFESRKVEKDLDNATLTLPVLLTQTVDE